MSIIIPRSVWKPRYANGFAVIGVDEWLASGKEIWLHHSVTNPFGPDATLEQDCQHMRDFEQIGQSRFGGGISYTWVTMPSGRVFEGHSIDRQGSHTYGRNNRARAICLAGKYHINPLSDRMANSVALLLRELGATIDGPHSAVYATDCPGDYARSRIGHINNLATSGVPIEEDELSQQDAENALWALVRNPDFMGEWRGRTLGNLVSYMGDPSDPEFDPNGKTSVELEAQYNAHNIRQIKNEIKDLKETGVPVTLDEEAEERIAQKVKTGLIESLQPLFDLAARLES